MKYGLIIQFTPQALRREVNEALADGWEPQGGVCVTELPEGSCYHQAIVLREKDDHLHRSN